MSPEHELVAMQIITFTVGNGMFWWGFLRLTFSKEKTFATHILAMVTGLLAILSAAYSAASG